MFNKVITFSILLIVIFSCKKEDKFLPKVLHFERDFCEVCKMGLDDQRYNLQVINNFGEVHWYDDFGCMTIDLLEKEEWEEWTGSEYKIWIGDISKDNIPSNWIDAETAFYGYGLHTPMGFGYSAYAEKPALDSVYDFNQVVHRIKKGITMRQAYFKQREKMN